MNNTYILPNNLVVESPLSIDTNILSSLEQALILVQERLQAFTSEPEFTQKIAVAFGDTADADSLQTAWLAGDLSIVPTIAIRNAADINGANGAYGAFTNKIYLSWEFLQANQANPENLVGLLLEEIGHRVDSILNESDRAGDEGAIFSALVLGESLSSGQLQSLKAEDDHTVITLDGQVVEIEKQDFIGTAGNDNITGTVGDDFIQGLEGNDNLNGLAGNDILDGGAGTNTLNGGDGDDVLINSFGSVDGGVGRDVLVLNYTGYFTGVYNTNLSDRFRRTGDNADLIYYAGIENFNITGTVYTDYLKGTVGDTIDGAGGKDYLYLDVSTITSDVTVDLTQTTNLFNVANTSVKNFESIGTITTGAGNDTIKLGLLPSTERGSVDGRAGNDTLILDFTGYTTGVYNTNLSDRFRRTGDNADLIYYTGIDNFNITGTVYTDYLRGIAGDTLDGAGGVDYLTLDFSTQSSSVNIDLTQTTNQVNFANTSVKNFEAIEVITTGSGDDRIKLGLTASTVRGSVNGRAGNDTLILDFTGYTTGVYNTNLSDRFRRTGDNADLIYYTGIDNFNITGTVYTDYLRGIAGDTLDGAGGVDYLTLDFSTQSSSVNIDLTQTTNQVNFANTSVKNFEAIEGITTGSGDDRIKLGLTASTVRGSVDGRAGNDTLILDFTGYTTGVYNTNLSDRFRRTGDNADLIYYAGIENFNITGTVYNDFFQGFAGNDTIIGGAGNDSINSSAGNDIIIGVNPYAATPGLNEIDTVTGGTGSDRFILGNAANIFYEDSNTTTAGTNDYALIKDFNPNEDFIQLKGSKSNYLLAASPINGISGTAIYLNKPSAEPDELIAIIEGVTGLDINSNYFVEAKDEIAFSAAQFSVNEDGTPVVAVTVTRTELNTGEVSATIVLNDGTATAGTDYDNSPITVNFASGETSKTVVIPITDDRIGDGNETINLTLTNPTGGAILGTQNTATLTIFDNEQPGTLAFNNTAFTINEDGTTTAAVTIIRTGGSDGQVSVIVNPSNGTATAPEDYNNSPILVTFADGDTTAKTVSIPIVNDSKFESNETINLVLTNPTGGVTLGTQSTATLTIISDDPIQPGTLSFSASQFSVNEDGTPVVAVTVTRTGGSDGAVSVTLTPSNGTATAPTDYNNTPITVNFANGETSKIVTIPIVDDTQFESDETINLTLTNPTGGATLGNQNTATLTIINNDTPQQGFLAFSNATYSVNEDGTPITAVTITRTGGSDGEVTATISLDDGSATAPQDYNNNPITVTFANGDNTPKIITIPIVNDTVVEGTETINLSLTNTTGGASVGRQNTAVVAIADDDVQLNFSTANYTVREDGTAVTDIIVTRTGRTTGAVSATITFTDGTATGCGCGASSVNNDFYNGAFNITLADGETSKIITVESASLGGSNAIRIRNDSKVEGDETFSINLTNPTGGATIGNQGSATVKILDDDVALAFSAANFSVRENGEAIAVVTVTRTGRLTGVVGATINLTDGTATAPSDYNNTPITISFAEGETSKTVFIPVNNDITVEPDETLTLTLTNPTGGATIGTQGTAVLTIVDNGQAPTLGVSINKDIVAENAGNAAAIGTVTRNIVTDQDLVITLTSSDTTEATVPTQVTILANQASATFNINAVDDGVADGAQPVIITASATGFSSGSRNLTVTDINVPDLVISNLSATTPLLTGKQAFFSYKVENKGLAKATATEATPAIDRVYLSTDNKLDSSDTLLGEFQFQGNFPVGQFYERNVAFFVPRTTGQYYLIAQTDATNTINEGGSIGDNNNTTILPVSVAAAYRAIVSTDTEIGIAGQSVIFKGQALSNGDNSPVPFEFVTIAVKNNGFVRELTAFTDGNGNFISTFKPLAGEGGNYQINAYFPNNPGEDTAAEDSFKLLGMRFASNSASHKVIADNTFTAQVNLQNLTDVDLNGLTYTVEGAPSNWNIQVNTPATLAGSGNNTISYTITAPNDSVITQDTFNIKLTSAEGVTATLPVSVDLERIVPRLVASTNLVSSGMLRGNQTAVEFEVKNEGGAGAENIEVLLPDAPWLKLASPTKINSLAPGESTKVTLLLTPEADLALTEYKGNIFLDATGNDGDLALPFNFRAVSNAVGEIRINTADELTYFAEGSPKLANATVTLRDYFTNEVIASTVTDAAGVINLSNINEGFYKLEVTAENHETYRQTIQLDAGEIENVNAFLSRQTVRYIWNVTPTEIEDKYDITVESVFETDVPIPTVVIDPPLIDLADLQVVGQVMQIDMTLTNYGLIAANNVKFDFGTHPFYKIEPLIEDIGTLEAKSSITVPVIITRIADFDTLQNSSGEISLLAAQPSVPCNVRGQIYYDYICGLPIPVSKSTNVLVYNVEGNCSGEPWNPVGNPTPGSNDVNIHSNPTTVNSPSNCDPNTLEKLKALGNLSLLLISLTLPITEPTAILAFALSVAIQYGKNDYVGGASSAITLLIEFVDGSKSLRLLNKVPDAINALDNIATLLSSSSSNFINIDNSNLVRLSTNQSLATITEYIDRLETVLSGFSTFFGDSIWLKVEDSELFDNWFKAFLTRIIGKNAAEAKVSESERNELLSIPFPIPLTGTDINKFIDRWNRTIDYRNAGILNESDVPNGQSQDFLGIDKLTESNNALNATIEQVKAEGFDNIFDGLQATVQELQNSFENSSGGVCARVRITIDQDAVTTRSAFLGELEIDNGNTTNLENLTVTLQVKDAQGNVVNNLFGITNPILKNITNLDGTGILTGDNPNTPQDEGIGSAQWTFIPTNLAAPEVPTQYSIGGTLSYTENGQLITVPLLSTPITVYPQAELYLDYFQQRNVYGDDPFTDQTETSVPFSLGVLVKNEGKGDAKNLRITSAQPKIVDNEKGLLIDFQIIGSQVNNETVNPSLTVNFGNIAAGETAVADWLLKSSLQGKFIEYKATFEHVNGLNNPELSLIKETKIHELIHKVRANDDNLTDFLVNDVFDANFDPDTLYFSSGGTAPVKVVTNATTDGVATFEDLTVQVSATVESGWTYLRLNDPGNGQFQIKKVLRSDGTELILDNVWTTDRTFPATGRPIYENILHLLDNNATAGTQTYTITYTTGDQTPPKVREIVDVDPNPRNTPVDSLDVVFTEPIKAATFDASDITLTLDGVAVNTNNLSITQVNANTYRIGNLQGITGNVGQYQLSVNAVGVQDFEGLSGVGVVTENWIFTGERPAVASISGFTSNRLITPVNTVTVSFTEAINPSSFDFSDLFLNRNGGGDLIKSTVTITPINATTYQINNLGDLTNVDGEYSFLINARGVNDTDGNTGVGAKGFTWTLDTNAPSLLSITDVTSPRNTKVSTLDIAFSKLIDSTTFDLSDVILTRDGTTNLITNGVTFTQLNNTTYRFSGLNGLQTTDGTYSFTVVGSGIKDTAGNIVTNSLSENWTLDTIAPNVPTNIQVIANLSNSELATASTSLGVTNAFGQVRVNSTSINISGSLDEPGLKVYVRDKNLNQSLGQATVNGTNFNSTVQLSGAGARELEIQVVDAAGNTTTTPLNIFADVTAPTLINFLNIPSQPVITPVGAVDVQFSETINLSTFNYQDITLTRDGGTNLITNAVTISNVSGTTYRINGLETLTQTPGTYNLQINTPGIQDLAGNAGIEPKNTTFTIQGAVTPGVTITQSNGSTNVVEGGATDTYTVVLKTQPTADVTITLNVGSQITTNNTTLTFTAANWNTPQTVTVTAVNDTTPEGNHIATITHNISSTDNNYNSLTLPNINVAIQDNDAEIRGTVWNDVNGDGIKGNDEPTLPNWTVYLDTNNNNLLDAGETSTLTNSQGNYTFNDLRPGNYTVAQVVQDGWKQTYPIINITTTASTEEIFTPSDPLSITSTTQTTTATNLINLDDFQADSRFANIKGQGYTTVIIDTGIDLDHPFFGADKNNDGIGDRIIYQYDFADNDNDASDKNGHGSHIASIAASIASNANIIALKVFKDNGSGYFSDLEAALQWVNQNSDTYNIASVNLSVGDSQNWTTGNPRYGIADELAAIASKNIIIAAAAGNSFYQFNSNPGIAYPAADPNTIAVGAVWADNFGGNKTFSGGATDYTTGSDRIASFSQRHPTLLDVFAPGIFITGANATGGTQSMGGTSQATPFISGIAVLAQQIASEKLGRELTLSEFRTLLDNTSDIINDGDDENDNVTNTQLNFPRVNLLALAEAILNLNSQPTNPANPNPDNNSSDDPLYLPSGSVKLTHTVTLTAGQVATDIDFGNQLLNNAPILENAIADQTIGAKSPFSFTLPANTFTDIDAGDNLTYTATLADDSPLPSWLTFNSNTFSGTPTLTDVGILSIKVIATDSQGAIASDIFTINIRNLTGTSAKNTITGTLNNDLIEGLAGDDTLFGLAGNDTLDGGSGKDTMTGGLGDDIYIVDNSGDKVVENADEGTDTVRSSTSYTLGENIENLILTGTSGLSGTGNALNNLITGNSGGNNLKGNAGNDTLEGFAGNDTLEGGVGDDLMIGGVGNDTYYVDSSNDQIIELANEGTDTVRTSVTWVLGDNVENLILTGTDAIDGTGNNLRNTITGNIANNSLFGGNENDSLKGDAGNDFLDGGVGNDSLDGGVGDDVMIGGAGNDTYYVDSSNDQIIEAANEGTDTVRVGFSFTLGDNLENLILTGSNAIDGTGNNLRNTIIGNSANNNLFGGAGNDSLDGGVGDDVMIGGAGNDTYYVDSSNDQIIEAANEGTDTVRVGFSFTLGDNVENLVLIGINAIDGTGNTLKNSITGNVADNNLSGGDNDDNLKGNAGNDYLDGGAGNDILNGGVGDDVMIGGAGNDTYYVDSSNDQIIEAAN
ncbi:Calx-beta domain-containing protein, partial [Nostoc cycadae]|uniref:Calx-beta domain-containing protein n=1 Tax=Nostoc cycadae TaxID=246795 RepID=UPI000CCC0C4D